MVDTLGVTLYYIDMTYIEQELKLLLDKRQYDNIVQSASSVAQHTNHYFYTDNLPMSIAVRIRHSASGYMLTAKEHVSTAEDISLCKEHNIELTDALALSMISDGISAQLMYDMTSIQVPGHMRYMGNMVTSRSIVDIQGHILEIDCNTYLGHTDYELEYECSDYARISQLRSILQHVYALQCIASKSKYHRFAETLSKIPMPL